jgi:hypothetical protein
VAQQQNLVQGIAASLNRARNNAGSSDIEHTAAATRGAFVIRMAGNQAEVSDTGLPGVRLRGGGRPELSDPYGRNGSESSTRRSS